MRKTSQTFCEDCDKFKAEAERWKALAGELEERVSHDDLCILSHWSQGEPTPDGGYRTMYKGKWYQTKPIDETPKCDCGLEEILSKWREEK